MATRAHDAAQAMQVDTGAEASVSGRDSPRPIPSSPDARRGPSRFWLVAATMLGVLLAAAAQAAKYPPPLERDLVREIRSRRYQLAHEAEETRRLAWPEWRPSEARCRSGGGRAWDAVVRDQVCAPLADDLKKKRPRVPRPHTEVTPLSIVAWPGVDVALRPIDDYVQAALGGAP